MTILVRRANIQKCVVHLQGNLLNKVRPKDKSAFSSDLKEAFNNFSAESSKQKARAKIKNFVDKWKEAYGRPVTKLLDEDYINDYLTYIDYSVEVRRMVYTTNSIENLNRQIRKITKTKISF
ncbi:MAG: transposase [Bacteroidota bacterium]